MKDLKDKISILPDSPGVYIFKDAGGQIIYIGKARSLKKRVSSYFSRPLDAKTHQLVSKINDIEYKITPGEPQAQILEALLIKRNQPKYNISLKDDKSFPWVKISREDFPVVSIARKKKHQEEDAIYIGPYTDAKMLRRAIKIIRRIFGYRSCKNMSANICLYGRLALCPAPCQNKISKEEYSSIINNIRMFLEYKYPALISKLAARMQELSGLHRFEEAAKVRDQINALSVFSNITDERSAFSQIEDLKVLLRLKVLPRRIECFDVSNISGQEAVGSMVSFYNGSPDKNNYRRFRIKSVSSIDDYGMIREVVRRRYLRLKNEIKPMPDLILIDGGRAHLAAAYKEIKELGLGSIPLASIAKEHEHIYIIARANPIKLKEDTPALNLIRHIRDEAHRFAVSYHHILRRKKIIGR